MENKESECAPEKKKVVAVPVTVSHSMAQNQNKLNQLLQKKENHDDIKESRFRGNLVLPSINIFSNIWLICFPDLDNQKKTG